MRENTIGEWRVERVEEYEREVLRYVRERLIEDGRPFPAGSRYEISVEDVRLERDEEGDGLVILFRETDHPDCLFGFGTYAVGPPEPDGLIYPDPEGHASIILADFEECLLAAGYGLPDECDPGKVNWIPSGRV